MKYLIYMSTSATRMDDADLNQLLRTSQAYNSVNNLTGMLLYSNGSFVQVLEGPKEEVQNVYKLIQKDPRHRNIIKLVERDLKQRMFQHWSMSFKRRSKSGLSKFDAYIDPESNGLLQREEQHPAITILKTFAEANF